MLLVFNKAYGYKPMSTIFAKFNYAQNERVSLSSRIYGHKPIPAKTGCSFFLYRGDHIQTPVY